MTSNYSLGTEFRAFSTTCRAGNRDTRASQTRHPQNGAASDAAGPVTQKEKTTRATTPTGATHTHTRAHDHFGVEKT